MGKRLPKDRSNWSLTGKGDGNLKKHGKSGHPHNHAVTIALNREKAREMEKDAELRAKRKQGLTPNVKDLFKDL